MPRTSPFAPVLPFLLLLVTTARPSLATSYSLLKSYAGSSFFSTSDWTYYGAYDNLTLGDVIWVNETVATSASVPLTYVNDAGNAIIKVDNSCKCAANLRTRHSPLLLYPLPVRRNLIHRCHSPGSQPRSPTTTSATAYASPRSTRSTSARFGCWTRCTSRTVARCGLLCEFGGSASGEKRAPGVMRLVVSRLVRHAEREGEVPLFLLDRFLLLQSECRRAGTHGMSREWRCRRRPACFPRRLSRTGRLDRIRGLFKAFKTAHARPTAGLSAAGRRGDTWQ